MRAALGGTEYFLGELAPRVAGAALQELVCALTQHAATWLSGSAVSDVMHMRPWSRTVEYSTPTTRKALEVMLSALRVAQLEGEQVNFQVLLASMGKRQGAKRWQAHKALQPWCAALRREPFVQSTDTSRAVTSSGSTSISHKTHYVWGVLWCFICMRIGISCFGVCFWGPVARGHTWLNKCATTAKNLRNYVLEETGPAGCIKIPQDPGKKSS